MDAYEWIDRARPVEVATAEVGFVISETFYHGPANNFSPEVWETLRDPLYQPGVERYRNYVLTHALNHSADELIKYYQDVLRMIDRYGKRVADQRSYFWLRPVLFALDDFEISFPWYDTWEEAKPLMDALESTRNGAIFSDIEQSWEVKIFATDTELFIRQGNSDSKKEHACVSCDRFNLCQQIPALRARCEHLIAVLRTVLGGDYWTSHKVFPVQ